MDRKGLGLFWFYCLVLVSVLDVGFFSFFLFWGVCLVYFYLGWIVMVVVFGVLFLFFLCALSVFF